MRRLASLCLVVLALGSSTSALAAEPRDGVRSQFYIFDPQMFESGAKRPSLEVMRPHVEARFARMLELKKDLLPGIGQMRKDLVFK